jgi:hypothetical protein
MEMIEKMLLYEASPHLPTHSYMICEKPDLLWQCSSCCFSVTCQFGTAETTHCLPFTIIPTRNFLPSLYKAIFILWFRCFIHPRLSDLVTTQHYIWCGHRLYERHKSFSQLARTVLLLASSTKISTGIFMFCRVLETDFINKCCTEISRLPLISLHVSLPEQRNSFQCIVTDLMKVLLGNNLVNTFP